MVKGLTPIATRLVALAVVGVGTAVMAATPQPAGQSGGSSSNGEQVAYFEKHIRPLLAEHCYECHSAGAKKLKANLRLDHRGGWMTGGDSGPPIVPGDPEASLLIKAVGYKDVELQMPPKYRLPPEAVAKLTRWIEDGAIDPRNPPEGEPITRPRPGIDLEAGREHWAYQPLAPRESALPRVTDTAWPINDIDHFILAELERHGLKPGPDADKVTLVRRLYFVLTGLPPTPQQIDAFINDPRTDAYERLVDQLLASPHYGERWGRHWLDVARYAESLTLRGFVLTDAWRYRDYIIKSFNEDRPFNQLMREQVAGDLMTAASDDERRRNIVATAFLALGNNNLEEQDKKTLEMDVVDEQLETVGRAFLGQTIGCARCHDHKFDPIPTADYYAMAGIFKNTISMEHANVSNWIQADLPMAPERERAVAEHEAKVAAMQAAVDALKKQVAKLDPGKGPSPSVSVGELDGIVLDNTQARIVGDWKQSTHTPRWVGDGYLADISDRSQPMTVTYQPDLPAPGKYELRMSYSAGEGRPNNTKVIVFSAAGETTLTVNQRQLPGVDGVFHSLGVYDFESRNQGYVIITNEGANGNTIADAVQFLPVSNGDGEKPKVAKAEPAADKPADKNEAEAATARLKDMERELKELKAAAPPRDRVIAIREAPAADIADVRIHIRGSRHSLGEVAPRGFLQVIDIGETIAMPDDQSGRLQLAAWLAHPRNPLPPRVTANRIWHWAMGAGLVRTPDNFGTTGEPPTHPALLDHLATQLTSHDWSIKQLVRHIVLSRTFRLSSDDIANREAAAADPENRLWWRANHRRLEAECIRDAMLAVSGTLNLQLFGQTYEEGRSSDFGFTYDGRRRSVYIPAFRNALPDALALFDAADTSVPTGRRDVSTVSPQALYMMNSPFVLEQSQAAAERLLADNAAADDHLNITLAYRQTLGRVPTSSELSLIQRHLERCRTNNIPHQQAWAEVFHALFGSIEFRYLK